MNISIETLIQKQEAINQNEPYKYAKVGLILLLAFLAFTGKLGK